MERMVRLIAQQYVKQLPPDQEFYTPQDLYEPDIPDFVLKRVIMEIDLNLSESIIPPHSEWADMAADSVQEAWMEFLDSVAEKHRLPASFAGAVFETAVADTLEMALQPREAIPAAIFGPDESLTIEEVRERALNVTVHKHLASAVVRYMDRKQKNDLTIEECKLLVTKIDERLVQNYNSLNWAQVLGPVFELAGPAVDTNFFRIFFEDKGLNRIARKFDLLNTSLNRTRFIEVLSSPEHTDTDDLEDDQPNLFEAGAPSGSLLDMYGGEEEEEKGTDEPEQSKEQRSEPEPDQNKPEFSVPHSDSETVEDKEGDEDEYQKEHEAEIEDEAEPNDSILSTFSRQRDTHGEDEDMDEDVTGEKEGNEPEDHSIHAEGKEDEQEEEVEDSSLHSRFMFDKDASEDETPGDGNSDAEETTLYKEMNLKQDRGYSEEMDFDDDAETGLSGEFSEEPGKPEPTAEGKKNSGQVSRNIAEILSGVEKPGENVPDEAEDADEEQEELHDDDEPIWKAFLAGQDDLEPEEPDDDGFIEEPVIDLTKEELPPEEKIKALSDWLKDDEQRFISGIFGGSEFAYEQALEAIYDYEDWKSASRYIEKEIFARNLVDVYEEVAVDFTDRLHTFFIEFKSSKMNG